MNEDRDDDDGQTRRAIAVAPMLLKVGLLNNVDLQIGFDPYTRERTTDHGTGITELGGFVEYAGFRAGITEAADDLGLFAGMSRRF